MFLYTDDRKFFEGKEQLRKDTLKVWQASVAFFNRAMDVACGFEEKDKFDMKTRIQKSALEAADTVAKAAYARCREEYDELLQQAEDVLCKTVSSLYIAQKWGYFPEAMFEQIQDEGRQLMEELKGLSAQASFSQSQLN